MSKKDSSLKYARQNSHGRESVIQWLKEEVKLYSTISASIRLTCQHRHPSARPYSMSPYDPHLTWYHWPPPLSSPVLSGITQPVYEYRSSSHRWRSKWQKDHTAFSHSEPRQFTRLVHCKDPSGRSECDSRHTQEAKTQLKCRKIWILHYHVLF